MNKIQVFFQNGDFFDKQQSYLNFLSLINCHFQGEKSYINYKNLDIFMKCCLCKCLFIDELYPLGSWQSFFSCIGPPDKLFICKLYIRIIEVKKRHFKDHFLADISQ